ncbi:hypothetical protein MSAS_15140 [Mycobacterium saskatchewanense]|nr:hypothetical protein MSAS_15140 [Mycobacterium saskatchewanense]
MANDAGPAQGPLVNPVTTELNDDAAAARSAASPSHAAAAANIGPEPAPPNINAELISGGNHGKEGNVTSQHLQPQKRLRHHTARARPFDLR